MQMNLTRSRLAVLSAIAPLAPFLQLLVFEAPLASASQSPISPILALSPGLLEREEHDISYEPDFAAFDRSLIGRAPAGVTAVSDNTPKNANVDPGKTVCFMVEKSTIFDRGLINEEDEADDQPDDSERDGLRKAPRADKSRKLYISANTCLQPTIKTKGNKYQQPPQLSLYISTSSDVTCPDGTKESPKVDKVNFDDGAVMHSLEATGDVYFSISAPNITEDVDDTYNFQVAISFDNYYYSYNSTESAELLWVDSDSSSVLLTTRNLTDDHKQTQQVLSAGPPFELFVQNQDSHHIDGLRHSVCGLENHAQIIVNKDGDSTSSKMVTTDVTTLGPGNLPKQRFYFMGLNSSSTYSGILVKKATNSTKSKRDGTGGGGTVFKGTNFDTLSGTNCKVVTNLDFCDEVQYAVPGNDKKFNNRELAKEYDNYAKKMYEYFEKAMMQIDCDAPSANRWSLVRTCDDCKKAYKNWLCTVSIPRCVDVNSNNTWAIARNVNQAFPNGTFLDDARKVNLAKAYNNASRNSFVDKTIQPGPYMEILPCDDVCYGVVQSCPAALGFSCPLPEMTNFAASYGRQRENSADVTCNYIGEARTKTSAALMIMPNLILWVTLPLVTAWLSL